MCAKNCSRVYQPIKTTILFFFTLLIYTDVFSQGAGLGFTSTDTALQSAFLRAKEMALHYKGSLNDPVGPWYESALPPRFAFCMRDVSHQSLAAEVLGMHDANKNMFTRFVSGISASKNWCSFWEINRYGKPAPADYRNDTAFWYNLNANFDVMNAALNLYLWTGDSTYIYSPVFRNFFQKSTHDYINSWVLQPGSLLTRPAHPNAGSSYNAADDFHRCRGLPSYSEGVPGLKMGVDLVAALYRGCLCYARIMKLYGEEKEADLFEKMAQAYQHNIDTYWWDSSVLLYNTYYSDKNKFGKDEGETFLLWFDALTDSLRKQKTLQHLMNSQWNIENVSYFPYIMYKNGYWDKAKEYSLYLTNPATPRREYPEASYGVINGFTEGLMGIEGNAPENRVSTLYHSTNDDTCSLDNVAVCGTLINVTHEGSKRSVMENKGSKAIIWRAMFKGRYNHIVASGRSMKAVLTQDWLGNAYTFTDVILQPGERIMAEVK